MTSPEIIDLVHDILSSASELASIKKWNKANSLLTLVSPGGSIGIEKETYEAYTREYDEATAYLNILIWTKNADPVDGEAEVRELAQAARLVLVHNRTLGGAVDDSYVHGINYATADGGKSLLLHLAELDFRVTYYADRQSGEEIPTVGSIAHDVEPDD
jgi:hypothetical protein